jgi:hypothetical protein
LNIEAFCVFFFVLLLKTEIFIFSVKSIANDFFLFFLHFFVTERKKKETNFLYMKFVGQVWDDWRTCMMSLSCREDRCAMAFRSVCRFFGDMARRKNRLKRKLFWWSSTLTGAFSPLLGSFCHPGDDWIGVLKKSAVFKGPCVAEGATTVV